MATETLAQSDFSADVQPQSVRAAVDDYVQRVRAGDLGSLPAILGLAVLVLVFSILRPETFPSAGNFANLLTQAAAITVLAMGLVFVLLLGEIDLSAGVTGGVCACVMGKLLADQGASWPVAVGAALVVGFLIGTFTGSLVALVGIPSFVVTLALFLAWQGITLRLIGEGGTVPINDEVIFGIANRNLPVVWGWILTLLTVGAYAAVVLLRWVRRGRSGVSRGPLALEVARIVVVGGLLLLGTAVLSQNRARAGTIELAGIPYAVPIVGVLLVALTFLLGRTSYGRHVYAVGGNTEAARRAGINTRRIRTSVFMIGSTMAAISGIIFASRLGSVTPDAGAGNTLLYAVGAAVIGGTSLFGGKGRVVNAVIGGLVIAVIDNGLGLLGQPSYINYLVTGGVLLLAASVDALSRKRAVSSGRA